MIVQVNQTNIDLYNELFRKAYEALLNYRVTERYGDSPTKENIAAERALLTEEVGSDSTFTSIDQYFNYIKTLSIIDKRFLMIPLDEKSLEVDANSRKIDIPAEYKVNGVGVEGDVAAETLIFKIDRYFDYMDLATARAYIQWELPNGDVGASDITLRDLESEPGKIIFGWTLTGNITKKFGSIKFSVRFFKRDENDETKLVYSFNTIPQTISLNEALQFGVQSDGDPAVDNASFLLAQAIVNSPIEDNSHVASRPVYEPGGLNLSKEGFLKDNTLELRAQALSADSGEISYQWERQLASEDKFQPVQGSFYYLEIHKGDPDFKPNPNKRYYVKTKSGYEQAHNDQIKAFVENSETAVTSLWDRFSSYTIPAGDEPVIGAYRVKAYNTVNKSVSLPADSTNCILAGPSGLSIAPIEGTLILTKNQPELTLAPVVSVDHSDLTALSYQWQSGLTEGALSPVINGGDKAALKVTAPGYYNLKVTANLNRADINETYDKPYRITSEPVALTVTPAMGAEVPVTRLEPEQTTTLTVYIENTEEELTNKLFSDDYKIIWGRLTGDEKTDGDGLRIFEPIVAGTADCISITEGVETEGSHRHYTQMVVKRKPDLGIGQIYVCQITNILNGLTKTVESGQFLVVTKG